MIEYNLLLNSCMLLHVTDRRFNAKLSLDDVNFLREAHQGDELGLGYSFLSELANGEAFRITHDASTKNRVNAVPGQFVELYLGSSAMTELRLRGKLELQDKGYHFRIEMPDYASTTSEWSVQRSA